MFGQVTNRVEKIADFGLKWDIFTGSIPRAKSTGSINRLIWKVQEK